MKICKFCLYQVLKFASKHDLDLDCDCGIDPPNELAAPEIAYRYNAHEGLTDLLGEAVRNVEKHEPQGLSPDCQSWLNRARAQLDRSVSNVD